MLDTLERNWVEGKKPSLHAPPVQTILREVESLRDTLRCARLRIERVQATMEFEVAKAEGKIQ